MWFICVQRISAEHFSGLKAYRLFHLSVSYNTMFFKESEQLFITIMIIVQITQKYGNI